MHRAPVGFLRRSSSPSFSCRPPLRRGLAAGDLVTDGGWGTASGLLEVAGYGGFPMAAAVLAGMTGVLAGRRLAESAFWSLAALPSYAASWILAVAAYAFTSTQFLGLR